jgi:hypothetical protein
VWGIEPILRLLLCGNKQLATVALLVACRGLEAAVGLGRTDEVGTMLTTVLPLSATGVESSRTAHLGDATQLGDRLVSRLFGCVVSMFTSVHGDTRMLQRLVKALVVRVQRVYDVESVAGIGLHLCIPHWRTPEDLDGEEEEEGPPALPVGTDYPSSMDDEAEAGVDSPMDDLRAPHAVPVYLQVHSCTTCFCCVCTPGLPVGGCVEISDPHPPTHPRTPLSLPCTPFHVARFGYALEVQVAASCCGFFVAVTATPVAPECEPWLSQGRPARPTEGPNR